jgi:adenosylhomocysteine nucleosidase
MLSPMSGRTLTNPCVIFALARESMYFRQQSRPQRRFPGAPCWNRFCESSALSVLTVHSGMGAVAAERAVNWILSKPLLGSLVYQPKFVIMAGFGGALNEQLQVGDVVLATEIGKHDGNFSPVTWPSMAGEKWKPEVIRGRIVTSNKLIGTSSEKSELGRITKALVVDMESAYVAQACAEKGVPFGCIRAISDSVSMELSSHMTEVFSQGRISAIRLVSAVLRSPKTLLEMQKLAKNTRIAARKLSSTLCEVLQLERDWTTLSS